MKNQLFCQKRFSKYKCITGLKGKSNRRLITLEEVKQHKSTEGHIWTVLKGRVYNISPYFKFHPGGKGIKRSLSNSILVGPSYYLQSGTCVGQVTGLLLTAGFYDLSGVLVEQVVTWLDLFTPNSFFCWNKRSKLCLLKGKIYIELHVNKQPDNVLCWPEMLTAECKSTFWFFWLLFKRWLDLIYCLLNW